MKKRVYVLFLIIFMINILTITVNAALSFTTSMTANNTKVEPGAEVVVSVKLSSIDVGEQGINTFSAQLGYDVNVFEVLTDTNVEGSNDWKSSYYSGTGRVTLTNTSFINSDEEMMQITLKVKSDVEDGTKGTVSLTNIIAANPDTEISASDVSTTITVGEERGEPANPGTIIVNKVNNNTVNNGAVIVPTTNNVVNKPNTVNNIINNNTTNNTTNGIQQSEDDIPYTGTETDAFMKIIVGIIIIALLLYRKIYMLGDI